MKKKVIIGIVIGVVIAAGIGVKLLVQANSAKLPEMSQEPLYTTTTLHQDVLSLAGKIEAKQVQILTNPRGDIQSVMVADGDRVEQGQALLTTNDAEAQNTANDLVNAVNKGQRDLQQQAANLEQLKQQIKNLPAEDSDVSQLQTQLNSETQAYKDAQADLANTQKQLNDANNKIKHTLTAPFAGVIQVAHDKSGAVILTASTNDLMVVSQVTEFDYPKVKKDATMLVKALATGNSQDTKINFVASTPDENSKSQNAKYRITADVNSQQFMDGQSVKIKVPQNTIKLAKQAVLKGNTVFLVRNGRAYAVKPTMTRQDDYYLITDGLKEGDKVVANPDASLKDKQKVVAE
ncbi:MAG: efflux RND transporter periplasmic adaptor subunit [Lactobacillaceae bacterium]|nr:efflux RND transporter periplasmic adaptor subunit [Lactobacillaceae bacterium]